MQIKNMSYIIALAEAGTLSAAGKQLGISQPTLSVFLSNLEQELGIDLFLRDKKKADPDSGRADLSGSSQTHSCYAGADASVHPSAHDRSTHGDPYRCHSAARF